MPSQDGAAGTSQERRWALKVVVAGFALALGLASPGAAAVLECASADVACLIAAINTANANGEVNAIRLQPGAYTLTAPNNTTPDGPNGLPSITSLLTIIGAGAGHTIIERETTAPFFRLLHVAPTGLLKLERLTVRGGRLPPFNPGGGGLLNRGTAIISQSALTDCVTGADGGGGGIASFGRLVIAGSTISRNLSSGPGGGVSSLAGLLTVVNSTISGNLGSLGGGLFIGPQMALIIGSTIADNLANDGNGGGVFSFSTAMAIINSTLAGNRTPFGGGGLSGGGGIIVNTTIADNSSSPSDTDALSTSSALALYNTIVAGRRHFLGQPACGAATPGASPPTSLGNNLFTDPRCVVALLEDDLIADLRLGDFTDNGTPGRGFLPLLPDSPAIDAADNAACLPTDQLGRQRVDGSCDIGAIEGVGPASPR